MGRFFRRGKSRILFLAGGVATPGTIARADITAAVDLSTDIADIAGFELSNAPIDTPNLADEFTPQIDGEDTVATSTLTIYDRDDSEVHRNALEKGTAGDVLMLPYGDITGKRAEIWPAKVTGTNDNWTVGAEAARFTSGFAIVATPTQNAAVPAQPV